MSSVPAPTPDPEFVEAVARRIVELLEDGDDKGAPPREGSSSLTVAQVAARYAVSRSWVYAHQRELGAMRLGSGPRARLRFNSTVVATAISTFDRAERCRVPHLEETRRRRGIPLIPFKPMG
jgi:hypothetical protein